MRDVQQPAQTGKGPACAAREELDMAVLRMRSARMYDRSNVTLGTSADVQRVIDAWESWQAIRGEEAGRP